MFTVWEYEWIVNCERIGFGPGVVCVALVLEGNENIFLEQNICCFSMENADLVIKHKKALRSF